MTVATPEPKTWATDDLLSADLLNTEIRDMLRFLVTGAHTTAALSADQSIPNGTRTYLNWGTVNDDTDGLISEPSTTFTFTRDGVIAVRFIGKYAGNAGGSSRNFVVVLNGQDVDTVSDCKSVAGNQASMSLSLLIPVYAGDQLQVGAYQDCGAALNVMADTTRIILSWSGKVDAASTAVATPDDSAPPTSDTPTKHVKTYYATWSRTFDGDTGTTWDDSKYAYQGYYDYNRGNTRSLVGFDAAQIISDLKGAQNVSIKLTYYVAHSYWNSGLTVIIGGHKYWNKPSTWSDASVDQNLQRKWSAKSASTTVALNNTLVYRLRTGAYRGIAFGPGPTTSHDYYGFMNGATMSSRPKLVVTFYK